MNKQTDRKKKLGLFLAPRLSDYQQFHNSHYKLQYKLSNLKYYTFKKRSLYKIFMRLNLCL